MEKFTMFIGLNDKDTKKQEIPTDVAVKMVYNALCKQGIECITYDIKNGVYKHDNGDIVFEKNIIVEMFFVENIQVVRALNDIKTLLNQESILLETTEIKQAECM